MKIYSNKQFLLTMLQYLLYNENRYSSVSAGHDETIH